MSFEDKYVVSKRGQTSGSFTAKQIIDLVRMREISTIHKVKVDGKDMTVAAFIETYEKGGLPEQNLGKPAEEKKPKKKKNPKAKQTQTPSGQPAATSAPPPKPAANAEIHVSRGEQRFGPYKVNEVDEYLKSGNLRFSDLVWYDGAPEWVPLSTVPGIGQGVKTLHAAPPPPNRPPPPALKPQTPAPAPETAKPKPQAPPEASFEDHSEEEEPHDSYTGSPFEPEKKTSNPMFTLLMVFMILLIVLIVAYFGGSWIHESRLKKKFEPMGEIVDFNLEGHYLFSNPRKGKVRIKRDGKIKSVEFKVTGNGVTGSTKIDLIKKQRKEDPADEDEENDNGDEGDGDEDEGAGDEDDASDEFGP